MSINVLHKTILCLEQLSPTNVDPAVDSTAPIWSPSRSVKAQVNSQADGQSTSPRHPVLPDAPFYEPALTADIPLVPLATLGDSATLSLRNGSNVIAP
jgi:hypothetical protein